MSQENLETLRRAHEAWKAEDLDAFLAEADPEVEWRTALEQALEGRGGTTGATTVCERPGTNIWERRGEAS
jgi:ketosteroid isomerase-like protein